MGFCSVCGTPMGAYRNKSYCVDCEKTERRRKYLVEKAKHVPHLSGKEDRELYDIHEEYRMREATGKCIPWQWK